MTCASYFTSALILGFSAAPCCADLISVPGDQPSIQAAINAAAHGDLILVDPGIYNETITLNGKLITVASTDGAAATTIVGDGLSSVVTFDNNETTDSVLRGFTLTGGGPPGGGVKILNGGATIDACVLFENERGDGAGATIEYSDAIFVDCSFVRNVGEGGGANLLYSTVSFDNCTFTGNFVPDGINRIGGGIRATFSDYWITNCTFDSNSSAGGSLGGGGAIGNIHGSNGFITGSTFLRNSASGSGGGAIWVHSGTVEISNSSFCDNTPNDITGSWIDAGGNCFSCFCDTDGDGLGDTDELDIYGTSPTNPDTDGDGLFDGDEVLVVMTDPLNPDSDGDGLSDNEGAEHGTNPLDPDSDDDGLFDGTEIDIAEGSGCPSPTDADSDDDSLGDGYEVDTGTSPCSPDTDNDGIPDDIDPFPNDPGGTDDYIEQTLRDLCDDVSALDLSFFDAPNNNAGKGRRNAMCNKLAAAANATAAGNYDGAIAGLESLLQKLDDDPTPPDWMYPTPERDAVRNGIVDMVELLTLL